MRKPQADEIRGAVVIYIDKIKEIDSEFSQKANIIPFDLANYAYSSRLQLLNDNAIMKRNKASKELANKITKIEIKYTIKDVCFIMLILTCIGILIKSFL